MQQQQQPRNNLTKQMITSFKTKIFDNSQFAFYMNKLHGSSIILPYKHSIIVNRRMFVQALVGRVWIDLLRVGESCNYRMNLILLCRNLLMADWGELDQENKPLLGYFGMDHIVVVGFVTQVEISRTLPHVVALGVELVSGIRSHGILEHLQHTGPEIQWHSVTMQFCLLRQYLFPKVISRVLISSNFTSYCWPSGLIQLQAPFFVVVLPVFPLLGFTCCWLA